MKKRKTNTKRKTRHQARKKSFLLRRYLLLIILFVGLLVVGLYLKKQVSYYYAVYFNRFQHKVLKNSPNEERRIERIVTEYSGNVFGMDISHYQEMKDIQWDSLLIGHKTIPLQFVVMRSTMGSKNKDKNFPEFWKLAKKHGLTRGAYHFYRPDQDPIQQANNYLESVKLESEDMIPVLDIEKEPVRISKAKLKENLRIWLKIVEEKYGKKPIIYTYYHYYRDNLRGEFDEYPLWLANYNNVSQPSPEDDWEIWQFTENGIVYGINTKVDLNVLRGGTNVLNTLVLK